MKLQMAASNKKMRMRNKQKPHRPHRTFVWSPNPNPNPNPNPKP